MEQGIYQRLLDTFMAYKGIGFATLQYRSKKSQELSKRLLNIGAIFENAKKSDLKTLINGIPYVASEKYTQADWNQGLIEVKQSCIKPNEVRSEAMKNAYINPNEDNGSVRYNMNTQEIYLFSKSEYKEIIEKGTFPVVKSSGKTLAKAEIGRNLKHTKFRTLILKNVAGTVKVNKQVIVVDGNEVETDVIDIVLE